MRTRMGYIDPITGAGGPDLPVSSGFNWGGLLDDALKLGTGIAYAVGGGSPYAYGSTYPYGYPQVYPAGYQPTILGMSQNTFLLLAGAAALILLTGKKR